MEACPYKKIYFNHAEKVAQKCIFCFPRIEQGVANACARSVRVGCASWATGRPGGTRSGSWWTSGRWRIPLHPEYGTDPNVFYVPPIAPPRFDENGEIDESKPRIPDEYLISLFGPKVLDDPRDPEGRDGEDPGKA